MAATKTPRLYTGPFKGVFNTRDPYDADPAFLVDAKNLYVADPVSKSGIYGRPGFPLLNDGSPLVTITSPSAGRGQAIYPHTMLDGSTINFLVIQGKLFRANSALTSFTDVTPVGVTISAAITTRVFFASVNGELMATDGVHRPWIATNLTSTPITGTYIDYDGAGVEWTLYGAPRVYLGSAFGILNEVNGISRRQDISWCEPGLFATGWQQSGYDNNWTLTQNEAGLLYALESDNLGLRYFREASIGAASGSSTADLQSTATDDALAFNIGSQTSQTIQKFGNGFFFCDAMGRPYYYSPGDAPQPIWQQMRGAVEEATTNYPSATAVVATATIEPTLNLYLVGIWSPTPSTLAAPTRLHVFDAITRLYQGFWEIGPGISIECIGTLLDSAGRARLVVLGSKLEAPAAGGYVWAMNPVGVAPDTLATESLVVLTTEDGDPLTTEGQSEVWTDNGELIDAYATSDRLGYDENVNFNVDSATVITLNGGPIEVTVTASMTASTVEGIPEPSTSQDGTYRLVCGCDAMGRGPQVTVRSLSTDQPFMLERVSLRAVASKAGPEDA